MEEPHLQTCSSWFAQFAPYPFLVFVSWFFETESLYIALAVLELALYIRLALNSRVPDLLSYRTQTHLPRAHTTHPQ